MPKTVAFVCARDLSVYSTGRIKRNECCRRMGCRDVQMAPTSPNRTNHPIAARTLPKKYHNSRDSHPRPRVPTPCMCLFVL